ncbi:MAG: hypothetical protein JWP91_50 [Fibrobacteres bacterium]|nr:hypothetical protein [Fibrobacterota bacterium]
MKNPNIRGIKGSESTKTNRAGRESGAAVLPIIITVAVAITLLQVPLLFKTKSGNKFSGAQKSNITAKSLAEAGIDGVIADIGRKAIRVSLATDTTPYYNVGLGRGNYTTSIKGYQLNPDRVKVVSTGKVGTTAQSIEAKMELVKTLTTIPYDTPKISLWGIQGTPPVLYYRSVQERDSGWAWIHPEGQVILSDGGTVNIDDFTVAPNGSMYFINNLTTGSKLYKIRPMDLDNNPSTSVTAYLVGPTGLGGASDVDRQIRGLTFVSRTASALDGVLYAVTKNSRQVFELSLRDGMASVVSNIIPKPSIGSGTPFQIDAMTQDLGGVIYFVRNNSSSSELWRFNEFESSPTSSRQDTAEKIADISLSKGKVRAIAGHPNGYIYASDDANWYRINPAGTPIASRSQIMFADSSNFKGMGFYWEREDLKFTGTPLKHKINLCHYPPGQCANVQTIQIDSNSLGGHSTHTSACPPDYAGYCGGILGEIVDVPDTTIQLKIISWEEKSGDLAHAP